MTIERALLGLALILPAVGTLPSVADAAPVSLRYSGTADLTAFGGTSGTPFKGSVTWDRSAAWIPVWPGCPDFCLDGSPGAVTATFVLHSTTYTDRIQPHSRLVVMGSGALILDLFFSPAIELDEAGGTGVGYVGLNLWSEPPDSSILDDGSLPPDLTFLPRLNDRFVQFSDDGWWGETTVIVDTVAVVPEPASIGLICSGLIAAFGLRRHVRGRLRRE